jgi:hypothetical protein
MNEIESFAQHLAGLDGLRRVEQAVAFIWYYDHENTGASVEVQQLAKLLYEHSLCGTVNVTVLAQQLRKHQDVLPGQGLRAFKLKAASRPQLDERYSQLVGKKRIKPSDSIMPRDLFKDRRKCW